MAATILVVEDNPHSRQIIKDILEIEGYTVWIASNGLDALELLGTRPHLPNLIISATLMPRMDGFALLSSVRARWPLIPFILLSTKADAEESRRGVRLGGNAIL